MHPPPPSLLVLFPKLVLPTLLIKKTGVVAFRTYLLGYLSEVADEPQDGALDQGVTDAGEVYSVTVEVGVESVHCLYSSLPLLLTSENQVYPVVEVATDKVALQSLESKPKEQEILSHAFIKFSSLNLKPLCVWWGVYVCS